VQRYTALEAVRIEGRPPGKARNLKENVPVREYERLLVRIPPEPSIGADEVPRSLRRQKIAAARQTSVRRQD
jgi:hypothetical protein